MLEGAKGGGAGAPKGRWGKGVWAPVSEPGKSRVVALRVSGERLLKIICSDLIQPSINVHATKKLNSLLTNIFPKIRTAEKVSANRDPCEVHQGASASEVSRANRAKKWSEEMVNKI